MVWRSPLVEPEEPPECQELRDRLNEGRFPTKLGKIQQDKLVSQAMEMKDTSDSCEGMVRSELRHIVDNYYHIEDDEKWPSEPMKEAISRLLAKSIMAVLLLRPEFFVTSETTKKEILGQELKDLDNNAITSWDQLLDAQRSQIFVKHNPKPTMEEVAELTRSFTKEKSLVDLTIDTLPWHIQKIDKCMKLIEEFEKAFEGMDIRELLLQTCGIGRIVSSPSFEELYEMAEAMLEIFLQGWGKSIPEAKGKFKAILNSKDKLDLWFELSTSVWPDTTTSLEEMKDAKVALQELIDAQGSMRKTLEWAIYREEMIKLLEARQKMNAEGGWVY